MTAVHVPEATVYKHDHPVSWKYEVGFSGECVDVKAITVAHRVQRPANLPLRGGVLAANGRHVSAPLLGGVDVRHKGNCSSRERSDRW